MPVFRNEIQQINPYVPGRPIEDVAREIGLSPRDIVKLASNESPDGPFPGVLDAAAGALAQSNRYPDNDAHDLRAKLSTSLGVPADHLWFGGGSTGLIGVIASAVGGRGTSAVYAWPSFIMYRIASKWAGAHPVEVELDPALRHDADAMLKAIRDDTTILYLCNPNNPTGTVIDRALVSDLVASVPDSVLVVVDEAYHHYVADPGYETALEHAIQRPNVIVLRTFSKVYALAALRIGYAVAQPSTITELRKAQAPFTVGQIAQVAAAASLDDGDELKRRVAANAAGRHYLLGALAERGIEHAGTETNFIFCRMGNDSSNVADLLTRAGVIVRPMAGGWFRVTIGHEHENERFVAAIDAVGIS